MASKKEFLESGSVPPVPDHRDLGPLGSFCRTVDTLFCCADPDGSPAHIGDIGQCFTGIYHDCPILLKSGGHDHTGVSKNPPPIPLDAGNSIS